MGPAWDAGAIRSDGELLLFTMSVCSRHTFPVSFVKKRVTALDTPRLSYAVSFYLLSRLLTRTDVDLFVVSIITTIFCSTLPHSPSSRGRVYNNLPAKACKLEHPPPPALRSLWCVLFVETGSGCAYARRRSPRRRGPGRQDGRSAGQALLPLPRGNAGG